MFLLLPNISIPGFLNVSKFFIFLSFQTRMVFFYLTYLMFLRLFGFSIVDLLNIFWYMQEAKVLID